MNQYETSSNDVLVNTRPLFSSTWLALFSVLLQHYNGRQIVVHARSETNHKKPSVLN